jgi:acyl-CoA thioesterase FadM
MAGEVIVLETAVKEIGGKSMTFHHRLRRMEADEIAFETVFRCVMLDLEARRATGIPDDVREKAAAYRVDVA